jgi:senataxin
LVCAPSNAAIDEVTKRLKEGVQGPDGKLLRLHVVRIGPAEAISPSVKDVSLDHLVSIKMNITPESQDTVPDIPALRTEIESVARQRDQKQQELRELTDPARAPELEKEIKALHTRKMTLSQKIDRAKDQQKENNQSMNALRRKCADDVLSEADVICTTLSGSGHNSLDRFEFETVIIDEAAQSIEVSSLIPLKYRCKRCILVGGECVGVFARHLSDFFGLDPQQLAPTVISQKACQFNYNQSLFVRIQKFQHESVHLLR